MHSDLAPARHGGNHNRWRARREAARATWPFLFLALVLASRADAQKRPMEPADLYRLVSVRSAEISPAGDRVAFTVTTVDEEADSRSTAVWVLGLADRVPVGEAIRFSNEAFDATAPVWSPDGRLLAFSSQRGQDPNRIWFARVSAPGGEAFHIEGVRGPPIWSPDGRWIAFIAAPEEPRGTESRRAGAVSPDAISRPADPARFDGHVITHLNHRRDGSPDPLPHPFALPRAQLFVVPATGGEPLRLTSFRHSVVEAVWSADGGALYVAVDESEGEDVRANSRINLYRIPAAGGSVTALTASPGTRSSLAISPDGRRLAFRYTADYGAPTDVVLLDLEPATGTPRGEPRVLTADWPLSPGALTWTPDGRALRFTARTGGSLHVFELDVARSAVRQITTGRRILSDVSFSRDGRWMAYTVTTPTQPAEVFVARRDGSAERRVTAFNDSLLGELELREPERISWRVTDGTEIEGWIMPPVGLRPDRSYPMILNIHGGPHAAYGYGFSHEFQVQAGAGFYVFFLNPRGSSGYGDDFQWAIAQGWGSTDEEDFIKGVAYVLEHYPQIDRRRLGVTGWSYGGFMTNWLTARTDLFAAAVTGASVVDWESDAGTTDIWYTIHREFGPLWEARDIYRRLSPLSYAENVTAPTLILHGQHDVRVPYKNAEQWFRVLKMRGVPVELVRYPGTGHVLSRPWHAVDRLERTRSWFIHWLVERPRAAGSDDVPPLAPAERAADAAGRPWTNRSVAEP